MDQGALVSEQIGDGQRLLERLAEEGVAVTAAAWVKESESGKWYLYIATPLVTEDGGKRPAYRRINTVFRQMPQPFVMAPFRIKVVAPSSPLAQAVADLHKRSAGRGPIHSDDYRLGDVNVEGAYIYPPAPTPAR